MDKIAAFFMFGAILVSLTNTRALIKDRQAKGIRPWLSLYLAMTNIIMAMMLLQDGGKPFTASVFILAFFVNTTNATLIFRFGSVLQPRRET